MPSQKKRYRAYIGYKGQVEMAEYRKGFKPENETHKTREQALIALAQSQSDKLKEIQTKLEKLQECFRWMNNWTCE